MHLKTKSLMRKNIFVFALSVLAIISMPLTAQSQKDSLWNNWLNHSLPDSVRISSIDKLARTFVFSNPDSANLLLQQMELSNKVKEDSITKVHEDQIFNLKLSHQQDITYGSLIAAFIVSLLLFVLYRNYKKQKENFNLLKQTQVQLVQQEKLASLGALTAGIAHEIKNPLNFVNNFSELSIDLIDDFEKSDSEDEKKDLLEDLKMNLKKINEHGKRADSIVKNMLQHSRDRSGEKVMTDINNLCSEFLNLAYHGMRANVPDFNSRITKKLDKDIPQISIVPQDISRVLLNLFNNAFYATHERKKIQSTGYDPEVSVETSLANNHLLIKVIDNGSGIPDHIKQKIFEPFYTTKPTGEGTGLGLSISIEIIKSHGGELNVVSEPGKFTQFTITLPITN